MDGEGANDGGASISSRVSVGAVEVGSPMLHGGGGSSSRDGRPSFEGARMFSPPGGIAED